MALAAQFFDVNKLIENFTIQDLPYYVIFDSALNVLSKNETDDNTETAAESLRRYFKNVDPANRQMFIVRQYAEVPKGGIKKTSDADAQSVYKNPQTDIDYSPRGYGNDVNRMMLDEIRELRREVSEMKMQAAFDDSDDDDETAATSEPTGIIGAILGNPALTNVLVNLLTNIGANLATQQQTIQPPRPVAMAGIEPTERETLDKLYSKGITINVLNKLAALPTEKINLYLSML